MRVRAALIKRLRNTNKIWRRTKGQRPRKSLITTRAVSTHVIKDYVYPRYGDYQKQSTTTTAQPATYLIACIEQISLECQILHVKDLPHCPCLNTLITRPLLENANYPSTRTHVG